MMRVLVLHTLFYAGCAQSTTYAPAPMAYTTNGYYSGGTGSTSYYIGGSGVVEDAANLCYAMQTLGSAGGSMPPSPAYPGMPNGTAGGIFSTTNMFRRLDASTSQINASNCDSNAASQCQVQPGEDCLTARSQCYLTAGCCGVISGVFEGITISGRDLVTMECAETPTGTNLCPEVQYNSDYLQYVLNFINGGSTNTSNSTSRLVSYDGQPISGTAECHTGLLQLLSNGTWKYVCDDRFDADLLGANVACREMGYAGGFHSDGYSPVDSFFDEVRCYGMETRLADCSHSHSEDCSTSEAVTLTCFSTTAITTPPPKVCRNINYGASDPYGDGCETYVSSWCGGYYDDEDFTSDTMCCLCGGGQACNNTATVATDSRGYGCEYYTDYQARNCGDYDDDDFTASQLCCVCGGGQVPGDIVCSANEIMCHDSGTDSSGNFFSNQVCAPQGVGCPCKSYEQKCYDGSCANPGRGESCPCQANETSCYVRSYGSYGYSYGGSDQCVSWAEYNASGCPCNSEYEKKCLGDQYGHRRRYYSSYHRRRGYTESTTVTTTGYYCTSKDSCCSNEKYCSMTLYDESGYWIGSNHSCIPENEDCPCSPQETRCIWTTRSGYTYNQCQMGQCPCNYTQRYCYQYSYTASGSYMSTGSYMSGDTHTCVSDISDCQCTGNNSLSTPCLTSYGDYMCNAASTGSCPVVCDYYTQHSCYLYNYVNGYADYSNYTKSCVAIGESCPCHPTQEVSCTPAVGSPYCESIDYGCPLDCSATATCWGYHYHPNGSMVQKCTSHWGCYPDYREFCAPSNAEPEPQGSSVSSYGSTTYDCPCDPDHEYTCTEKYTYYYGYSYEYQYCRPKIWYSGCPLDCGSNYTCTPTAYSSDGVYDMNPEQVCTSSWSECDGLCGANAKLCQTDYYDYCVWQGDECPLYCGSGNQTCYIYEYDSNGWAINYTQQCWPSDQDCPCHANNIACQSGSAGYEYTYCTHPDAGCPLYCDSATEHQCTGDGYFANGTYDPSGAVQEKCEPYGTLCQCGANAVSCHYNDYVWNYSFYWCMSEYSDYGDGHLVKHSCPISCTDQQQPCYVVDYDTAGNVIAYEGRCIGLDDECPCGKNQTKCSDTYGSYCLANWDSYNNAPQSCPLACDANLEDYCSIPNYDGQGTWTGNSDYCGTRGSCDCTRGQNAKACTYHADTSNWTECIHSSSYCPVTCPAGQAACPDVKTYTNTGEYVETIPPAVGERCKADVSQCLCGTGEQRCEEDGRVFCRVTCPQTCAAGQKLCNVVDFADDGTVANDQRLVCSPANSTCQCGTNAQKCPTSLVGVGTVSECVPLKGEDGKQYCPCQSGEQVCVVKNYDTSGQVTGTSKQCVAASAECPCGTNAKRCADTRDATQKTCIPSFLAGGNECPKPCTMQEEAEGKKTCRIESVDSSGKPKGKRIQCQTECTAGAGFKTCVTDANILSGYPCRDLYGVLSTNNTNAAGTAPVRRRLQTAQGLQEAAILSFSLNNLQSRPAAVDDIKLKLDSIVQLPNTLNSELTVEYETSLARMQYRVVNIGEIKNGVGPQAVTEHLRGALNAKEDDVVTALASIGTINKGTNGCCTSTTGQTQLQIVLSDASTSTPQVMTSPQAGKPPEEANKDTSTSTTPQGSDGDTSTTPQGSDGDTSTKPKGSDGDTSTTPQGSDGDTSMTSTSAGSDDTETTTAPATTGTTITFKDAKISGDLHMEMPENQIDSAIANPAFELAVESSIATTVSASSAHVSASLSKVTSRRLTDSAERRLSVATLLVNYNITLTAAQYTPAQQQAAHTTLQSLQPATLSDTVTSTLGSAQLNYTITVIAISAPVLTFIDVTTTIITTMDGGSLNDSDGAVVSESRHWVLLCLLVGVTGVFFRE